MKLNSKGQVTIPAELRHRHGFTAGDDVEVVEDHGVLRIVRGDDLTALNVRREDLPYEAAFSAGSAFLSYRRRGGSRRSTLPDFYIGAHAAVRGYTLLTRDRQRYSAYFPELALITP